MIVKELIPLLADSLGVPLKTAIVIDRSLADAGFRRKHKGPNPPDMTRIEALNFMLGCMVALDTPTKAGEELEKWDDCTGWLVSGYFDGDLEIADIEGGFSHFREEMPEDYRAALEADLAGKVEIHNRDMREVVEGSGGSFDLMKLLLSATRWASKNYSGSEFRFEVVYSHGFAFMDFRRTMDPVINEDEVPGRIRFQAFEVLRQIEYEDDFGDSDPEDLIGYEDQSETGIKQLAFRFRKRLGRHCAAH